MKALRFGRSSDPEEPATREARRGSLARALLLSLLLSFALLLFLFSLVISAPPLLPSSLSPACSLLPWSYGINCSSSFSFSHSLAAAHSSPILRIALYLRRLARRSSASSSSSSASYSCTVARKETTRTADKSHGGYVHFRSSGNEIALRGKKRTVNENVDEVDEVTEE